MTINYETPLKPYMPIQASGFFFADHNGEIWCFDPGQERVFHVGAEIEMMVAYEDPYNNNGYQAATLKEAFEQVESAVGNGK